MELMQIFSKHVSDEVAEAMWRQRNQFHDGQRPPPQQVPATIMFADISGFTTISEQLEPQVLFDWLNEYMEVMAQTVIIHHGMVNKYIGDAIMALFGMPFSNQNTPNVTQDAKFAVDCALAMRNALNTLNQNFAHRGLPTIAIRIGIYTGMVAAGALGSSQRLEYAVIGDTVNTAARLEQIRDLADDPEEQNCRILIGAATLQHLDPCYQTTLVKHIALKGKQEAVAVYRLKGILAHDA